MYSMLDFCVSYTILMNKEEPVYYIMLCSVWKRSLIKSWIYLILGGKKLFRFSIPNTFKPVFHPKIQTHNM